MPGASLVFAVTAAIVGAGTSTEAAPEAATPSLWLRPLDLDTPPDADDVRPDGREWFLIAFPLLVYRPDDGPGAGAVVSGGYRHHGSWPWQAGVRLRTSLTTLLVQRHELRGEGSVVLGLPVSLRIAVGWYSTRSANYCGVGNGVSCSTSDARVAGADADDEVVGAEIADTYYRVRYMEPYLDALLRVRLWDGALDVDTFARARSAYHLPGDASSSHPYPGSLYQRDHPDGERGLWSVPELGLAFDTRDVPALPTRGLYLETSARGTSALWSESSFGGAYASAALWRPLKAPGRGAVGARVLADALVGDAPVVELGRTGGTEALTGFGGPWLGRGIRESRYIGKLKVVSQTELRTAILRFLVLDKTDVDVGVAVFGDAAWIGADWHDLAGPGGDVTRVLWSAGIGLRLLINQGDVVRLDVAFSPVEERGPQFYGYSGKTGVMP